jgi:NADH dehydrogenase FAD-containing subunit
MFIELEDGYRVDYDGLLLAIGTESVHKNIDGLKEANKLYLDSL